MQVPEHAPFPSKSNTMLQVYVIGGLDHADVRELAKPKPESVFYELQVGFS
jgi:hypothetical protein